MDRIKVSTPGKLMLFGEHAVVYNRPCIVTAVDQRFEVTVTKLNQSKMIVEAPGVGMEYYCKSLNQLGKSRVHKGLRFVEATVRRFYRTHKNKGLHIKTENHFSSEYGFGSSAAVTVGLSKGLHRLYGVKINDQQLFDFCYQVVLDVQGVGSGFDIAAALFGGVLYFVTGGKKIEKLSVKDLPIVVGYTGVKADTPTLVRQVAELKRHHPTKIKRIFNEITIIVDQAKKEMETGNWVGLGKLMNKNQKLLQDLGISSVELDNLIKASLKAGAKGAKLSGAGGGDCMVALVDDKKINQVEKAIETTGGKVLKVKLGAEGVRVCQNH